MATSDVLFALLRSAICETELTIEERSCCSQDLLGDLLKLAKKHDVVHLAVLGLKKNGLLTAENGALETSLLQAVFRYERKHYEYTRLCQALETLQISFLPLKGAVLRNFYPEPWMRTSCDVDILVRNADLEHAVSALHEKLGYAVKDRSTHDVALDSPSGIHVELHYDLVEEGRANNAIKVLSTVWQDATPRQGCQFFHEMSDAFFYFYHIAHMAEHFETGGCGIRPFVDLWILERMDSADTQKRNELLEKGGLKQFADVCRKLSHVWFEKEQADPISWQMQAFLLHGGAYGTVDNRVMLQQKKQGGRLGYLWSRLFAPREKLERYYPILKKYRVLLPFMQVRRWFMLLQPSVAGMAKKELQVNTSVDAARTEEMQLFLDNIGL